MTYWELLAQHRAATRYWPGKHLDEHLNAGEYRKIAAAVAEVISGSGR
jgi:hypothetical protein